MNKNNSFTKMINNLLAPGMGFRVAIRNVMGKDQYLLEPINHVGVVSYIAVAPSKEVAVSEFPKFAKEYMDLKGTDRASSIRGRPCVITECFGKNDYVQYWGISAVSRYLSLI